MGFEPFLSTHFGKPEARAIDHYLNRGGYGAARAAFEKHEPAALIELVKQSGLRGRGGAGFPAGMKWGFVPKNIPKPRYLCVNADESEPGTFKDRAILEFDPHVLLEGILICCRAVEIHTAYIYIRAEFTFGAKVVQNAIDEAYAKGFFGKNVFGSGFDVDVTLHRGGGAYICGEETGLLSSLEGGPGLPKIKPPFPAVSGLFGCPTVINNVETIANLPYILARGVDWHKSMGTEKSPGSKLFCVCGHVNKPGLYEKPLGYPMKKLLYEDAGGILGGRKLKAVFPGGSSAPVLTAEEAEKVTLDYEALGAAKSMLGSGGVIVLHEDTCMVNALYNIARFYHHESCGQCTPCREGLGWIEKICRRLEHGQGRMEDLDLILDINNNMRGKTICLLADSLAMPAHTIVQKWRKEFEYHVTEKKCMTATRDLGVVPV